LIRLQWKGILQAPQLDGTHGCSSRPGARHDGPTGREGRAGGRVLSRRSKKDRYWRRARGRSSMATSSLRCHWLSIPCLRSANVVASSCITSATSPSAASTDCCGSSTNPCRISCHLVRRHSVSWGPRSGAVSGSGARRVVFAGYGVRLPSGHRAKSMDGDGDAGRRSAAGEGSGPGTEPAVSDAPWPPAESSGPQTAPRRQ
jgi:hypothetical protein